MTDGLALTRLLSWLSPVFPTGGFAFSSALEAAVHAKLVTDQQNLQDWLHTMLDCGRLRNDAIFLCQSLIAWDDPPKLEEVNELVLASSGTAELHLETVAQGEAFMEAARSWHAVSAISVPKQVTLPVAIGASCGAVTIDRRAATIAYLNAYIANQLQIAIRLSVIGQKAASAILAALETSIVRCAEETEGATIDDLGSATLMADIMSMRHETQNGRLFRS